MSGRVGMWLGLGLALFPAAAAGAPAESSGNTDGVVTWHLGVLDPGQTASRVVLLAYADSYKELAAVLAGARKEFAQIPPLPAAPGKAVGASPVWIKNAHTNFALEGPGHYFWEGKAQSLACRRGGQISRFGWYVHYQDGQARRAGTPISGPTRGEGENLKVLSPARRLADDQAVVTVETADGRLRLRLRARMGQGTCAGVEIQVTNVGPKALTDVKVSAYANLESAHDHQNDYSVLDATTGSLLTVDSPTGMCVAMTGVRKPDAGYSGVWPSQVALAVARGEPAARWKPFLGLSGEVKKRLARTPARPPGGIYAAYAPAGDAQPTEPPTRTLSADEARAVLEKDWLFQAEGKPLGRRAGEEILWARALARRLKQTTPSLDLTAELKALDELAGRPGIAASDEPRPSPRDPKGVPAGLLARWSFDQDQARRVEDVSGQGRHGRLVGRRTTAAGVFGEALDLGGGHVNVGTALAGIARGPYTISAWIRTTSGEADVLGNGTSAGCFLLMSYQGVVRGHHWTGRAGYVVDGKVKVADGRWHHVAQVVDDKEIRLFVDGRPDGRKALVHDKRAAGAAVTIGGRGVGGGGRFDGLVDELCVFGRALTPKELQAEFAAGRDRIPSPAPPTKQARDARELYLAVRRVKRRIMLKNPVVDFSSVLFIDNPFPQGREWPHQARHRDGMMAVSGGRLLVLDGLGPGGRLRKVAPTGKPGSFWRPDLSFDAKRVLFCMKPHGDKAFHLYETDLASGATRQLTRGDYDDTDPIYLPDGHIMFTTTRANTYVRCMPYTYSYILARCDADGGNIYIVSQNNEPDWCPALLNDGRIIYSRWEYTDKALWRIQSLWTVNQDGTNVTTFWGNQSVWPDHLAEPQPIPGSRRVMFTGLAHHNWFAGSIGIIDPAKGYNFPRGLTKVTRDVPWPECGRPPVDPPEKDNYHTAGRFTAYKTPWPLSEEDFLVSARSPERGDKFLLYLMDTCGNRELIYEGVYNIWHAMPVRRRRPPIHRDRVAWPGTGKDRTEPAPGVLYSTNVRQNVPTLDGGKVKYLRVIQMDAKTYSMWTRDFRHEGPAVSVVQAEGVKRILGTVPVEADGSVHFKVPPGAALHFQLLDEHYRALQTMRSFVGVMPGEERGCVGCHELHTVTPVNARGLALREKPRRLTPPPWGPTSINYERMVQPVLDKHCGKCHQGAGNPKARKKLDLTLRPGRGMFKEPYITLVGPIGYGLNKAGRHTPSLAGALLAENYNHSDPNSYTTAPPMTYLSCTSRLIDIAFSGKHNKVKVDPVGLRTLIAWVDANCPYRGEEDIRALPDPSFAGIERLPVRPRVRTAPKIPRP